MLQLGLSPNSARNLSGVGVRPRNGAYDHSGSICGRRLVASPPPDRSRGFQSAAGAHNRSCSASDDGQDVGRPVEQVLTHPTLHVAGTKMLLHSSNRQPHVDTL